eukprot:m.164091 g.164091  ORF g.164091 m.164091 type:complete len:245 (-) comp15228_c0_seq2:127-861(-)
MCNVMSFSFVVRLLTSIVLKEIPLIWNVGVFISYVEDPNLDAMEGAFNEIKTSCGNLDMGPVNLMLLHWPGHPDTSDAKLAKRKRAEIWKALELAKDEGLVKDIGVSNFSVSHLEELAAESKFTPCVNQIERHPYLLQNDIVQYCRENDIHIMAYCPLASGGLSLIDDPVLVQMAAELEMTVSDLIMRWHVDSGVTPVPKSKNAERIKKNLTLPPTPLSSEKLARINALGAKEYRVCPAPHNIV